MHDAFTSEILLENLKHSISTLHGYSNKLIIVDSQYTLTHYHVFEHKSGAGEDPSVIRAVQTVKGFSKSKPVKLHAIKETDMLLVLADSYLSLYSLSDFSLVQKLNTTKGATTFSVWSGVDHSSGIPVLSTHVAVCVKRQVLVFTWLDSEFEGEQHFECPDRGRSVEFLTHDIVVVATTNDFVAVYTKFDRVEVLQVPIGGSLGTVSTTMGYLGTRAPKSILTRTSDQMLMVKDVQSSFIDDTAEVLKSRSIGWASAPEFVGYTYPYLIVVLKNRVEVRNAKSGNILQAIDITGVQFLNDGKSLLLATSHRVYRLNVVPYDLQVEQMVGNHQLDEALSLVEALDAVLLDDKAALIRRVKELMAREAFEAGDYDASMDLFGESWTVPSVVVDVIPQHNLLRPTTSDTEDTAQSSMTVSDNTEIGPATSRSSMDESSRTQKVTETVPILGDSRSPASKDAMRSLSTYLARTRRLLSRFISTPPETESDEQYFTSWPSSRPLTASEMEKELGIADTSLLRIYILNSPGLVGSLVRLSNRCDPKVVKEYLVQEDRWKELVDFYYGKKLHQEALALLRERNAIGMGIQYLQRLDVSQWQTIEEFAPWALKAAPADAPREDTRENIEKVEDPNTGDALLSHTNNAMDIFTDTSRESNSFDRTQVATFLTGVDSKFAIEYLEFLIISCGDTTPHFSEDLIYMYIKTTRVADLARFIDSNENAASSARIYSHIPHTDDFNEVRALVLAKLGNLDKALQIYVNKINDPQKAEEFAINQYKNNTRSIELLLGLYLTAPAEEGASTKTHLDTALDLLKRHGPRLDADQVLTSIPPRTPLASISDYLKTRLGSDLLESHSALIESKLREAALLRLQTRVIGLRKRYWEVGVDRVCGVCHKRLGNSVLAVFPDGGCVHYGCQKRYHMVQKA